MDVTFTTNDPQEIKRLAKSEDMAFAIFEIVKNGWRRFKHTDYDYHKAWHVINEILEDCNINIDELTS